ncbi:MAG: hypothetical protein NVS3B16_02950 [Vulcanimicrobiaceae bacterium]
MRQTEDDAKCVADRLEDLASATSDDLANDRVVKAQSDLHFCRPSFPAPRALLDIGEQKDARLRRTPHDVAGSAKRDAAPPSERGRCDVACPSEL